MLPGGLPVQLWLLMADIPPSDSWEQIMYAAIKAIEYYLPGSVLTNEQLERDLSDWSAEKILEKTGISKRYIVNNKETASDLACQAAQKLFASDICVPNDIDFLLFCTQSPDHILPTTACVLQDRLGLPTSCGALDYNLGCSGYIYGLLLAKGLIESGQANNVLLITAETYSKYIGRDDKSVRTIFGDGAAATLVQGVTAEVAPVWPVIVGTDGRGANNLIVRDNTLHMNGPEIFTFTLKCVPLVVAELLTKVKKNLEDIDLFIFHQANKYMLDHLRTKLNIPEEKFYIYIENVGNTVSSTIPIAMKHALLEGKIKPGSLVMLVGFGVGYSWGGAIVRTL